MVTSRTLSPKSQQWISGERVRCGARILGLLSFTGEGEEGSLVPSLGNPSLPPASIEFIKGRETEGQRPMMWFS